MLIAITRDVSPGIGHCELTYLPRIEIDLELARAQHRHYQKALLDLGSQVVALPAEADLPDSVFVEDVAVVLDEIGVIARPGAESRRPEAASVAAVLARYRKLVSIEAPGTLEGGDVLRLGKTLYVGRSQRSNPRGIRELADLVARYGYRVKPVEVNSCLHLKSAVSQVAPETLLINPGWVDEAEFDGLEVVRVDRAEPYAANALFVSGAVIYPVSFPRTRERLAQRGIAVTPLDLSELQKAEGAVTCCSLVFGAEAPVS